MAKKVWPWSAEITLSFSLGSSRSIRSSSQCDRQCHRFTCGIDDAPRCSFIVCSLEVFPDLMVVAIGSPTNVRRLWSFFRSESQLLLVRVARGSSSRLKKQYSSEREYLAVVWAKILVRTTVDSGY